MNILDSTENTPNSSEIYCRFLNHIVPDIAPKIAPLIARLFNAWADGHSYIYLNNDEQKTAQNATPLIGQAKEHVPFILSKNRLFIAKAYFLERDIAQRITQLSQNPMPEAQGDIRTILAQLFPQATDKEQKLAAAQALLQPFLLLTGGPGTGKTTTVAKILTLLCQTTYPNNPPRIALSAPTGKAAAHLQNALNQALNRYTSPPEIQQHLQKLNGQTLHRLLKIDPPLMQARYNKLNPLPYDIIIVDEASMIDLTLMHQLLSALHQSSRLILLGDAHQLPSVGAGSVLAELTQNQEITPQKQQQLQQWLPENTPPPSSTHAQLKTSHRFGNDSGIGNLAHAVNTGDANALQLFNDYPQEIHLEIHLKENPHQLYQHHYQTQEQYWQAIKTQNIEKAFEHFYDSIMLCVLRQDAEQFNQGYLNFLHTQGHQGQFFDGHPLMITRNNPANGLYNGDIGIILNKENKSEVYFPEQKGFSVISVARLAEYCSAFSLTVHKSQGSEYRKVQLLSPSIPCGSLFDRTLLYTALTRAKKQFTYIGSGESFQAALEQTNHRRTAIKEHFKPST